MPWARALISASIRFGSVRSTSDKVSNPAPKASEDRGRNLADAAGGIQSTCTQFPNGMELSLTRGHERHLLFFTIHFK